LPEVGSDTVAHPSMATDWLLVNVTMVLPLKEIAALLPKNH
jgi:hypothetical protein